MSDFLSDEFLDNYYDFQLAEFANYMKDGYPDSMEEPSKDPHPVDPQATPHQRQEEMDTLTEIQIEKQPTSFIPDEPSELSKSGGKRKAISDVPPAGNESPDMTLSYEWQALLRECGEGWGSSQISDNPLQLEIAALNSGESEFPLDGTHLEPTKDFTEPQEEVVKGYSPHLQGTLQKRRKIFHQSGPPEKTQSASQLTMSPHYGQDLSYAGQMNPTYQSLGSATHHANAQTAWVPAKRSYDSFCSPTTSAKVTPLQQPRSYTPAQVSSRDNSVENDIRYRCPCGKPWVYNGNNDGVHCTECFNRPKGQIYEQSIGNKTEILQPIAFPSPIDPASTSVESAHTQRNLQNYQTRRIRSTSIPALTETTRVSEDPGAKPSNSTVLSANCASMPAQALESSESSFEIPISGTPGFELEHESVDAAREYIENPPSTVCEHLSIEGDDWEYVKFSIFRPLCEQLFHALTRPPAPAPGNFTPQEKEYYKHNHDDITMRQVQFELRTPELVSLAKAKVMVAMDKVVRVHERGVPMTCRQKARERAHPGGYDLEQHKCLDRAKKVIEIVGNSKYVALDILLSKNLDEIARAPVKYALRKLSNVQNNACRSRELQHAKAIRNAKGTAQDQPTDDSSRKRRGGKQNGRRKDIASTSGTLTSNFDAQTPNGSERP